MRRFSPFIIGLFGIIIFSVAFRFLQEVSKPKYEGPIDAIRIGNVREYSIFNAIARQNGYFSQNGLDAKIIEYESGPAAMSDLLAGKLDVAFASDNAGVQNMFTNSQLKIVSQFVKNTVFSVVARKDKKILMPSDLKGKRIGVTKKTAGEFLLSQFLIAQNLRQQDITEVDLTPSQIKSELTIGKIDAGVLFEPNVFDLINTLKDKQITWPVADDYSTFGLIFTTDNVINLHKDVLTRYLKSLVQAEDYLNNNPQETKNIVQKQYGYSKAYIDYSWPKNKHSIELDQELLLSLENIASWAIKNKLTTKITIPNYLQYIYFDALEQVKPDSVTIIH